MKSSGDSASCFLARLLFHGMGSRANDSAIARGSRRTDTPLWIPPPIPITEKLLSGAGGWQAMKAARELVKAGGSRARPTSRRCLQAKCARGRKTYRAGLRIRSASEIENICTCRESREWGKICAHSLAVGLAYLAPVVAPPQPTPPNDAPARIASHLVSRDEPGTTPVALHFILPPNFRAAWAKGADHGLRGSGIRRASRDARRAPA